MVWDLLVAHEGKVQCQNYFLTQDVSTSPTWTAQCKDGACLGLNPSNPPDSVICQIFNCVAIWYMDDRDSNVVEAGVGGDKYMANCHWPLMEFLMLMLITGIDSPARLFEESFGRPPFFSGVTESFGQVSHVTISKVDISTFSTGILT